MDFLRKYWSAFVIISLVIMLAFTYNLYNNAKIENENIRNENSVAQQIDKVETNHNEVDKREKETYPKIDKDLSDIKKKQKDLRRKIEDEVKKDNINSIAHKLTLLGYSSCIIRK